MIRRKTNVQNEKELKKQTDGAGSVPFCTCTDLACPCHPSNHDKGCAPCIAKNLSQREIPSCFFKKVDSNERPPAYYFENFAEFVEKHKEK